MVLLNTPYLVWSAYYVCLGEMEVHLKDCGAKYVFTAPELSANVLRAASSSANQAQVFLM